MTAQFSVTNSGNTAAFVKIVQGINLFQIFWLIWLHVITTKINILEKSSEDIIQPNEFILKKGETTNIEISIVMSPERLEMLIGQNCGSKVININKISLIYGDEASRMRVSRLVFYWVKK